MSFRVVTYAERPEMDDRAEPFVDEAWPTFMEKDPIINATWHVIYDISAETQVYLVDEDTDELIGIGNTVSFAWDGDPATLPDGVIGVLPLAVSQREAGIEPNTLCALQAIVPKGHQGEGLSTAIVKAMAEAGRKSGYTSLVAPVRPTAKDRYPLTPMERYITWVRDDDGLPVDPWLRVHARLGAEIIGVCLSMRIPGTIAEWESWTGLSFPDDGEYVIPQALVPITIDHAADQGLYLEPNVWMKHPLESN